jgi:hypothetical protein
MILDILHAVILNAIIIASHEKENNQDGKDSRSQELKD